MRTYGQYCPIARAAEIFAERWTPVIVRNILLGHDTFSRIHRGAPGLSKTLLTLRLRELERFGIIERRQGENGRSATYVPTSSGRELWEVCETLGTWGARWLEVLPEHLDPYVALWSMSNSLNLDAIPDRRLVVRFDFTDLRKKNRFWLLLDHGEAEVCLKPPGPEDDLVVTAASEWFVKWHMGWASWSEITRAGHVRLEGPRDLVRAFPTWNRRSHFAGVTPVFATG
jgi:DNA-binding HxlR family transcriptional regulator